MAEATEKMERNKQLPQKCEFCQSAFKDPKVLPCFHILCRECVRNLQVKGMKELKCPVNMCNKKFTCREMDPESLPDASIVYHLQDLHRFKEKLEKGEMICMTCLEKEQKEISAVASCDQCDYICKKCKKRHSTEIQYSDHDVRLFLELSVQLDDSLHLEMLRRSRSMSFVQQTRNKCKVHPKNNNTSFCMDCKRYLCPLCIDKTHSKHCYRAATKAAKECTDILKERIPSVQLGRNKVLDAVESVRQSKVAIEDQKLTLTSTIDSTFNRLEAIMERRKKDLKLKLDHLTERKISKLSAQQLDLERLASEMERMVQFTEKALSSSTERELLTIYPFLHKRIQDSSDPASEQKFKPVEAANTAFKSSAIKDLTDICRRDLEVYSEQACPGACSVEGDGLKLATTMHYSQFIINVVDRNNKPCPSIQDVAVRIKCCENEFTTAALVHDRGTGRYHVSFCPQFRGKHEIHVSVNNKAISGSPFLLSVHMPRSQLGIAQGFLHDVTQPRGIVFAPNGNILICEWNGKRIIEMDQLGRRCRALGSENVSHPASLALSASGDIFVIEGLGPKNGVVKLDKYGKLLKSVCGNGTGIGQFKSPRGVKIGPSNEVFVCDRDNGRIQVYDLKLDYLRCINLWKYDHDMKKAKPNDLAFDRAKNMYIADYSNNCIHQLNPKEEYMFTFSQTMEGRLAGPECLAIDDAGYLYVTESQTHRVSVFQTSGECVKTFGCKGKGEGEFNFPMGIAVDENGGVFVCEMLNNRIQVF